MRRLVGIAALCSTSLALTGAGAAPEVRFAPDANGIAVGEIKVYDDRTLQLMMYDLAARLGGVSPIDQAGLIGRIGNLQGASSTTRSFNLQASGPGLPGEVSKTTTPGPTVTEITSASPTTKTVLTPSVSTEVQTTTAAINPTSPALPSYGAMAAPTAYGVSSLDALGEQVQLGYELANLRLLLRGALNDDYARDGFARRPVTFGFPINIETPGKRFRDAAAEVHIVICNPPETFSADAPLVRHVLPREKTYNVASLTSSSTQLGASAVISSVANIGGSFLSGKQTYYLVRDQDTIAVERPQDSGTIKCPTPSPIALPPPRGKAGSNLPKPDGEQSDAAEAAVDARPDVPAPRAAAFAWQFRPVLGRRTVQQGMRQTFAQIAFAPGATDPSKIPDVMVGVRTCWRKYDRKSGIVGDVLHNSCTWKSMAIRMAYDTTNIASLLATDNQDGTISVTLNGTYPAGTRIAFGDISTGEGNVGFSNVGGRLRFTAPLQLVATRGARILSPDGREREIALGNELYRRMGDEFLIAGYLDNAQLVSGGNGYAITPRVTDSLVSGPISLTQDRQAFVVTNGARCELPDPTRLRPASYHAVSTTQVEITLDITTCRQLGPQGPAHGYVALLGGKAFGLSDQPFARVTDSEVVFTAPRSLVQGRTPVVLRRMFTDPIYDQRYMLDGTATSSIASMALLSSSDSGATFVLTGTRLGGIKSLAPTGIPITVQDNTVATFSLTKAQLGEIKKLMLKLNDGQVVLVDLPAVSAAGPKKASLKTASPLSRSAPTGIRIDGSNLDLVQSIDWQGKAILFVRSADGSALLIGSPPAEMLQYQGKVPLRIKSTDGTDQYFDLDVGP
nr:hypothetical protein [Sphingomonas sp. Y57]